MNKKILGWFVIVLILFGAIYFADAQEKEPKVKLLWEKNINELQGMVKHEKLRKLKQEGKKPNAIRVDKGVILFDDEGDIVGIKGIKFQRGGYISSDEIDGDINTQKWTKATYGFTSDYGSYTLDVDLMASEEIEVEVWNPRYKRMEKYKTKGVKYTLYDFEGNIVSSKANMPPDSHGVFISDADGTMAAVNDSMDGTHRIVQFYDRYGNLLNQYDSWKDSNVKEFIGYQGAWSENGEYFAFLHGGETTHLILFDKRGNIVWKKEWAGDVNRDLLISRDGNIIVAATYKGFTDLGIIYVFDKNGNLLNTYPFKAYQFISPDGNYIAIKKHNKVSFYEMTGKLLWEKQFESFKEIWNIDISENGKYIVICGAGDKNDRTTSPKFIYIYNKKGEKIWDKTDLVRYRTQKIPLQEWGVAKISRNGRYIIFFNEDKIWFFENLMEEVNFCK